MGALVKTAPLRTLGGIQTWLRLVLVLVLLAVTQFVLSTGREISRQPVLQALAGFPRQIGPWTLHNSYHNAPEIVSLLGVDDYIDLTYTDARGRSISLYVGYYEAIGNGTGYHSPKNCLPGGGWGIHGSTVVNIPGPYGIIAPVIKLNVGNKQDRQTVLYWYQDRGRVIASEIWSKIFLVLDALLHGRRDGAFVRIMSISSDNAPPLTNEELYSFASKVMGDLTRFIPGSRR